MTTLATVIGIIAALLLVVYLLLKFNYLWIGLFDRARRNPIDFLPEKYNPPRYYVTGKDGWANTAVKWPGWDLWYFNAMPDRPDHTMKMLRGSAMTGLYGLNGIDDSSKIPKDLKWYQVVEYMSLIWEQVGSPADSSRQAHFSHFYLPKETDLAMTYQVLETIESAESLARNADVTLFCRVTGSWPHYLVEMVDSELEVRFKNRFEASDLLWWADISGVFTSFTIFGEFEGEVEHESPKDKINSGSTYSGETGPLEGLGFLGHGCARKPININTLWLPIKWLKYLIPSFKPVRHHFEVFFIPGKGHCGFMKVLGFGFDLRDIGGIYFEGSYQPIKDIEIEYLDDPPPDDFPIDGPGDPVKFYRRWKVKARAGEGILEYVAVVNGQEARVAPNMFYYNYVLTGTYNGKEINGTGYGEYAHI